MKLFYCGECPEYDPSDDKLEGRCIPGNFKTYPCSVAPSECTRRVGEIISMKVKVKISIEAIRHGAEEIEVDRYIKGEFYNLDAPGQPEQRISDISSKTGDQVKNLIRELYPEAKFIKEPEDICEFCGGYYSEDNADSCRDCGLMRSTV